MRKLIHINASSIDEVILWLRRYGLKASVIAGGTDLLEKLKDEILPTYPEAIINIKTVPGLDFIKEQNGFLKIGAVTRLHDIAVNSTVKEMFPALAMAAHRAASPNIRQMGTIGGNICQDIRCWYYRSPQNRFPCLRKGGGRCYAIDGDDRYHSIFGGSVAGGCYAVHPSDIAPALIALDATIKTSARGVSIEDFFQIDVGRTTILSSDEIVTEIHVPTPSNGMKSTFIKFAMRKSIDFPIVNCALMLNCSDGIIAGARICLNAVYVKPYRALKAEEVLLGKAINESTAVVAAEAAVASATPLKHNGYMVQVAKTLVKRAILACM